jgi:predicted DNA-binding protein (UPF0278 family)
VAGMRFKRQKDQVNHIRKRLRGKFNGNLRPGTIKSRPDGQNLQNRNTKSEEKCNI